LLSGMCPVEDGYWIFDVGCWEPPFRPGPRIHSELPSALFPPTAPRSALPQTSGNTRCSPEKKAATACSSFQKSTQPTPHTPDGRQKSERQTRRRGFSVSPVLSTPESSPRHGAIHSPRDTGPDGCPRRAIRAKKRRLSVGNQSGTKPIPG